MADPGQCPAGRRTTDSVLPVDPGNGRVTGSSMGRDFYKNVI